MPPTSSRAVLAALLLLLLAASAACSKIPAGRSAIDDVRVRGARVIDPDELGDKLATASSPKFLGLFRGVVYDYEIYDPTVLQRDLARVERYYRGHGFFEAHARAGRVEAIGESHVRVEIVVEEGPPTTNRAIRIDGLAGLPQPVADDAMKAARDALGAGWRFNEDDYAKAKVAIKKSLTDDGYAWADVASDAAIDVGARAVDYVFTAKPGPEAKFGAVTITGLDPAGARKQEISEASMRDSINIQPGERYSTRKIDDATQSLLELEVFNAVEVVPSLPDPPPADAVVPVAVRVEPAKLRDVRLGFGGELDFIKTEAHLRGRWEDHNFLGGLRTFSVDLTPGLVFFPTRFDHPVAPHKVLFEEKLRLSLRQPAFLEQRTAGFIQPELNLFPFLVPDLPDDGPVLGYVEMKNVVGVDRYFGKRFYAKLTHNLQAELPFVDFGPDDLVDRPRTLVLSYPALRVRLDLTDDLNHPHSGVRVENEVQVAGGPFGGVASDVREQPTVNGYIPLSRKVTLAIHTSVGLLLPADYGDSLSELGTPGVEASSNDIQVMYFRGFFGGGPNSNRGFPLRGLAPHGVVRFLTPQNQAGLVAGHCAPSDPLFDPTRCALPIGGFTMWEASIETRVALTGPFSTAFFCDAGDVSPRKEDFRFDRLHLSCGAGFRYDTPAGPLRLDFGYRVPPLQIVGRANEAAVQANDPSEGVQPTIFGVPMAISFGIGEAF